MVLRKLLCHSYVKVYSQQLRDTLTTGFWRTHYGWRFYGYGSRFVLIYSQVPWTLSLAKNAIPHFKEHCTKIDISLVVIRFFFSQTNPDFKYNPLFSDILDSFCYSLFTFLPFDFKNAGVGLTRPQLLEGVGGRE